MSDPISSSSTTKPLPGTASEWFARLRSDVCTEADRAAFTAWLAADPAHRGDYRRIEALWQRMARVDVSDFPEWQPPAPAAPARPPRPRVSQAWPPAIAAVLVMVVGLVFVWWQGVPTTRHYATALGERENVTLADGTKLELNTATELAVRYTNDLRMITLQRGEAYLEVTHNPARPLVVQAGAGEVCVLGTRFIVYRTPTTVTTSVIDGLVQVSSGFGDGPSATRQLRAGERLSYSDAGHQSRRQPVDVDALLAWRRGELVFHDRPLTEVIEELQRYHPSRIRLLDERLGQARVSGVFKIGDVHTILSALAVTLGAKVNWVAEDAYLTERRTRRSRLPK
ncbi:MAG: FecR family protein [Gammaproteobacteria bacterium]